MEILNSVKKQNKPLCIALGCFDGLHIGHRKIITSMCRYAEENDLTSAVFTFTEPPASVLGRSPFRMMLTQSDKLCVLESLGVDVCFSIDFLTVRNITAQDFIDRILIDTLNTKAVFCGFNYRFGKTAQGDSSLLRTECEQKNMGVVVCEPVCYGDKTVSSSRIRDLIENGEIRIANKLLCMPFSVESVITEGRHNGRTVGIPTINQSLPNHFVTPRKGVYASFVIIDGKRYESITNIGTRPTVGGDTLNIETHILNDYHDCIYGKTVRTQLLEFVRDEQKFDDLQKLSVQIKKDIAYIYDNGIYNQYK